MAVLSILMVLLSQMISMASGVSRRSSQKIQAFQQSRRAFEIISSRLESATLNTYLDYDSKSTPTQYLPSSHLHFVIDRASALVPGATPASHPGQAIFFQAPLGFSTPHSGNSSLNELVNTVGYYVEGSNDKDYPLFLTKFIPGISKKYRHRLVEFLQPAEQNRIYTSTAKSQYDLLWMQSPLSAPNPPINVIAENILLLAIRPRLTFADELGKNNGGVAKGDTIAPNMAYDSRAWQNARLENLSPISAPLVLTTQNVLPPLLDVVLVAIDEQSAQRLYRPGVQETPAELIFINKLFLNAREFDDNVKTVQETLNKIPQLNYRIFRAEVALKGAKWNRGS